MPDSQETQCNHVIAAGFRFDPKSNKIFYASRLTHMILATPRAKVYFSLDLSQD